MFKSKSLYWTYSSLLLTALCALLVCSIHSWAKCPSPLSKRLELGGGSNQASALETAQATQIYFMYAQRAFLPTDSFSDSKTDSKTDFKASPTCDQRFQLSYGLAGAYGQAQENSLVWSVLHQELKLKFIIESAWRYGVGTIGLQAGIGALWLNESQERLQASRLNPEMLIDDAQTTVILSREGQQIFPLFTLGPIVRLQFIETTWGELGLSTQFKVNYRLLNPDIPQAVSPWGWGIQFGLFFNFGQVFKPVQANLEHK